MQTSEGSRNVPGLVVVAVGAALCFSCSGGIAGDQPGGPPGAGGAGGSGAGAVIGGSGAPGALAGNGPGAAGATVEDPPPLSSCAGSLPSARAVMLTTRPDMNALRDLLGEGAVSDADVLSGDDLEIEVVDRPRMTTAALDQRLRLAEQAVTSLRGEAATRLGCPALTDRACVRGAIERLGLRAYKRPLEAAELDDAMALYDAELAATTTDAGETAALFALQAVLSAPSTLYRTEFTGPTGATTRALSAYERAAALGAWLLDSLPDDALLAAAADGSLMTPAGMQTQIDRLLALPRVQDHLTDVVLSAYRAPRVFETPKDEALFPEYTPALQQSMYDETHRFVQDVLWDRNADLSELLTSRKGFVDDALADVYGIPAPAGGAAGQLTEVELPESRAGLLTQASVLSVLARTDKTSVVARGLFVRGAILCQPKIGSPPESVQAQVTMQLNANSTQAELAAYRAMTDPCSGCHSQFDRFGLLLEKFDPIGKERMTPAAPIDLAGLGTLTGTVGSPRELAEMFASDGQFVACLARRTLAFALTEAHEASHLCTDDPIADAITGLGGDMHALVSALATQPAFFARTQEP